MRMGNRCSTVQSTGSENERMASQFSRRGRCRRVELDDGRLQSQSAACKSGDDVWGGALPRSACDVQTRILSEFELKECIEDHQDGRNQISTVTNPARARAAGVLRGCSNGESRGEGQVAEQLDYIRGLR